MSRGYGNFFMKKSQLLFKKTLFVVLLLFATVWPCQARSPHRVLILCYAEGDLLGGEQMYKISQYKALREQGVNVEFLIVHKKSLHYRLLAHNIPHQTCSFDMLRRALLMICKEKKISVIHTSLRKELEMAKSIRKHLSVKVIATLHVQNTSAKKMKCLRGIDGLIVVNDQKACQLAAVNENQKKCMGKVVHIPPFFDETPFRKVNPTMTASDFFKTLAGLSLDPSLPIITSIAHFYKAPDETASKPADKNHTVLIKAMDILVNTYKTPCYLMLAGEGPGKQVMIDLVRKLNLEKYIHFLGNVERENIPELLHHSTIKTLTSNAEGTGIVLLEAAMLKKPLVGTRGTGMEVVIKDQETGLLFEKNNENDLAEKLYCFLHNPGYAKKLGVNAHNYVNANLSNHANVKKYLAFLSSLYRSA